MSKRTPGSVSALRQRGTYLQNVQWGGSTDVDRRYQVTKEEERELLKTGYYMIQWRQLRGKQ
jgi:hypothetical protein